MRDKEKEFEFWMSEQFVSVCAEENWSKAQLSEPNYVLVEDDQYPDKH